LNDPSQILSIFLEGALGRSGRKRARKAARFVSGNKGLISASSLLAVAGVAWGIYDSMKSAAGAPTTAAPPGWSPQPVAAQGVIGSAGASAPVVPPIPGTQGAPPVPPEVLRLVRLTISAARADGQLSASERALILAHARQAGVEAEAERELEQPRPLSEIVGGVSDDQARRDLYTLAFSVVRADESVTGAERIYLAQLAHQLGLDAPTAAALEADAAARIDAEEPGE
jgi:uncharacterized membrane protein YebE (DUF533 family)